MPRLEVDISLADGEHVAGTVRCEDGEDVAFVGWIALLSLLQAAVIP
jgi:hypothetical protein